MTEPIPVVVRYPGYTKTILIVPTRRRCIWIEFKPRIRSDRRGARTRRIIEWREAYWRGVGAWPTNEQTAEVMGCSVSTVKYHLRKARNASG